MSEPRDVQTEEQEQTEAQQAAAETVDEQVEAAESAAVEGEIVDESAARIAELEKALAASEAKFNEQQDSHFCSK